MHTIAKIHELDDLDIHPELIEQLKEIRGLLDRKKYKELFIATKDEVVTGIAISWLNDFHPTAKYIRFFAVESMPTLLEAVLQPVEAQDKIVFSCWEDEHEKITMVENCGFQLFRQTYMAAFPVEVLLAKLKNIETAASIKSLEQILLNDKEAFFTMLKTNYEQTHTDNPAQSYTWQEWGSILLDDEVDAELSGAFIEEEQIKAYIMLHPVTNTHYEIGWIGQSEQEGIQALFKWQLLSLQQKGIQSVEIEVDTTDWHAMKLFSFLNLQEIKSWNSYMLSR
ncbi:hypothetical protein [Bacillus ndiopicus]|uniref:hypothetical protein n=1 Tax=Bacillus ndiopicus TaxID=1347368 RepID=UPI0005AA1C68|nr:hypothetical protein [Bacillus ndiopicus]